MPKVSPNHYLLPSTQGRGKEEGLLLSVLQRLRLAYQQHLKTEHFQKYKQGTLHMVKDLKLPTMKPLDPETMGNIFMKMKRIK